MSAGSSRSHRATSGITSSAPDAVTTDTQRHPTFSASQPSSGSTASWPVAVAAVSPPTTRPRRDTNQRLATVAASTVAMQPDPAPTHTPHSTTSCQDAVIAVVARAAVATTARAPRTIRRMP
jgi:hypothetical protein